MCRRAFNSPTHASPPTAPRPRSQTVAVDWNRLAARGGHQSKTVQCRLERHAVADAGVCLGECHVDVVCLQRFMSVPEAQRHLYEIHTAPQSDLVSAILSTEHIVELARLRDFLGK
jgi:hypothetical protein